MKYYVRIVSHLVRDAVATARVRRRYDRWAATYDAYDTGLERLLFADGREPLLTRPLLRNSGPAINDFKPSRLLSSL